MKRFFALAVSLAILASAAPTHAQLPPFDPAEECGVPPEPNYAACAIAELKSYVTYDVENAAIVQAQIKMWEAYAALEDAGVPDEDIPEQGLPAFDYFRTPGDPEVTAATTFRGMFYYPWYPEDWGTCDATGSPSRSKYDPARGCYSQNDTNLLAEHVTDLNDAHVDVGIYSWYRNDPPNFTNPSNRDIRFQSVLDASAANTPDLKWALLYEREGNDPNLAWNNIRTDLNYAMSKYGSNDNYLRIEGRPVVFVWADPDDGCGDGADFQNSGSTEMMERWRYAIGQSSRRTSVPVPNIHPVMKVFPGYRSCPANTYPRTDFSFYQYAPAAPDDQVHAAVPTDIGGTPISSVGNGSYVITPGFYHFDDTGTPGSDKPFLDRRTDSNWRLRIRNQIASGKFWQLITTYNEFAEGTQVEATEEFDSDNLYLRALIENGQETFTVMAAGDIACDPASGSFNMGNGSGQSCRQKYTAELVTANLPDRVLALGDTQYEMGEYNNFLASYDLSWGQFKDITRPAVGNHEYDDPNPSGFGGSCTGSNCANGYFDYFNGIDNPGLAGYRTGTAGQIPGLYDFRLGNWHLISFNSEICGGVGGHACESGTAPYNALVDMLAANADAGCQLIYMHHPRWSHDGTHPDQVQLSDLYQLMYDNDTELMVVGHSHNYERFARMDPSGAEDNSSSDGDPIGIRYIVAGTGGRNHTPVLNATALGSAGRTYHPIQASSPAEGAGAGTGAFGVLELTLAPSGYDWDFQSTTTAQYTGANIYDDASSSTESCH